MTLCLEEEKTMHPRLYRLMETYQRIDEALRLAQQRRQSGIETLRLQDLKLRAKHLIQRFARTTAHA